MSVFIDDIETKRMIFNVRMDLAERLEIAKADARDLGKKLDHDNTINKALEKFLKKAEKRIAELKAKSLHDPAEKSYEKIHGKNTDIDDEPSDLSEA